MASFSDDPTLDCNIEVTFPDGTTGTILFPCGSVFDTEVLSNDPASSIQQIPLKYQVYTERAILRPCCWWEESTLDPEDLEPGDIDRIEPFTPTTYSYSVVNTPEEHPDLGDEGDSVMGGWRHETTQSFKVVPVQGENSYSFVVELINGATSVPTKCTHPDAEQWHQGQDGSPPCNGAKTECPYYTGPKFKHITDRHLRPGKPIIGQQVQELRSLARDWNVLPNAEEVWNQTYESPYIWARDFDDLPVILVPEGVPEDQIGDVGTSANLVRIKWIPESEEVVLTVVPSTPGDPNDPEETPLEVDTPPRFYTIVGNLSGSIRPPIGLTFPPPVSAVGDNIYEDGFTFDSISTSHKMYLAGTTLPVTNVYIVNSSMNRGFEGFATGDIPEDSKITSMISDLVDEVGIQGSRTGFSVVTSDRSRFWELATGVDLIPNSSNEIVILVRSSGLWQFIVFDIHYGFHQVDIIQEGYSGILSIPQTQSLVTSIANLTTLEPLEFKMIGLGGDPSISSAYHYYVYDRSASRFVSPSNAEEKPDRRYWKVVKDSHSVAGTATGGNLRWSKFNNCNKYLIEILNPKVPAAKPAAIDRGWEPRNIEFSVNDGGQGNTTVKMQVIESTGEFGRSMDGNLVPVRFLVVEPVGDQSIYTPENSSVMTVDLEVYRAVSPSDSGDDVFEDLYEEFPDSISDNAGGVPMTGIGDNVVLASTPAHEVTIEDTAIKIEANKYDVSYMVEIAGPSGEVLGRRWIYGVAEMSSTWVRDIDIQYSWSSNEVSQGLSPNYSRATAQLNKPSKEFDSLPTPVSDSVLNTYIPRCGDHEGRWLFSTYDGCEQSRIYINTAGIIISQEVPTGEVWDERYRGPDQQEPYSIRHNPASVVNPCVFEWSLGTKTRTAATWAGLARIKGPISPLVDSFLYSQYLVKGWIFPQFGNKGRDHLRIYRTMHYREYIYAKGSSGLLKVGVGWMPAIPFIGSTGIADDTQPRTIFDYAVENVNLPAIDYGSFEGQGQAIQEGSGSSLPSGDFEQVNYERRTFDDTYLVRKPGAIDPGIQWPRQGWYFNTKDFDVLWGFPEPVSDVARDYTGEFVEGVVFRKPVDSSGDPIQDRFSRTIDIGPLEGDIPLEFTPMTVSPENGNLIEYAQLNIDSNLSLYFDQFTGEIKTTNLEGDLAMNGATTKEEMLEVLTAAGLGEPEVVPVFEPSSAKAASTMPTSFDELEEVNIYGNIVSDGTKVYIYPENGAGGDNLNDDDLVWKAFFRSIEVVEVNVAMLPTISIPVEDSNEVLSASGVVGVYPSTEYIVREALSGKAWPPTDDQLGVLGDSNQIERFRYEAYSKEDLSLLDPSKGEGYTGPVSLICEFPVPVELSKVEWSYELKPRAEGIIDSNITEGPRTDPSVSLRLVGNATLILIEKPRFKLPGDGNSKLREFSFGSDDFEPLLISSIVLEIGSRDDSTGIWVSPFEVTVERAVETSEVFRCLNPKYIVSRGYGSEEPLYQPSQRKYLSHITTTPDQPDVLETAGIAEFWQPGMASFDEVGTYGKIRRHYASEWSSYDSKKYLGESTESVIFADDDVEVSEARQERLIEDYTNRIADLPRMLDTELKYMLLPQDRFDLELTTAASNLDSQRVRFSLTPSDKADSVIVAETTLDPGWQSEGFHACIPDRQQIVVNCIVNLGILGVGAGSNTAHSVYKSPSHDTCGTDLEGGRSAYTLFEFGRITEKIVGGLSWQTPGATAAQAEAGVYDDWGDYLHNQTVENRVAVELQKKIDESLNNRGRYRP